MTQSTKIFLSIISVFLLVGCPRKTLKAQTVGTTTAPRTNAPIPSPAQVYDPMTGNTGNAGTTMGITGIDSGTTGGVSPAETAPSTFGTAPGEIPQADEMSRPNTNAGAFNTGTGFSGGFTAQPSPSPAVAP